MEILAFLIGAVIQYGPTLVVSLAIAVILASLGRGPRGKKRGRNSANLAATENVFSLDYERRKPYLAPLHGKQG